MYDEDGDGYRKSFDVLLIVQVLVRSHENVECVDCVSQKFAVFQR